MNAASSSRVGEPGAGDVAGVEPAAASDFRFAGGLLFFLVWRLFVPFRWLALSRGFEDLVTAQPLH